MGVPVDDLNRRKFLQRAALGAAALSACQSEGGPPQAAQAKAPLSRETPREEPMEVRTQALQMPWHTEDPFLLRPPPRRVPQGQPYDGAPRLSGWAPHGLRFLGRDGWSMYHGRDVPGFPRHPHRGFETITVTLQGCIDHSDSLGATARYGEGDVQWMTAGKGIVHSEMFPLREQEADNPTELFQLWLNLPAKSKLVDPHFTMFWKDAVPVHTLRDDAGRGIVLTTVAGAYAGVSPPAPPPESWASQTLADTAVWTIALDAKARFVIPKATPTHAPLLLSQYTLDVAGTQVTPNHSAKVPRPRRELSAGESPAKL